MSNQIGTAEHFADPVWKDDRDALLADLYRNRLIAIHKPLFPHDTEIIAYARDKETAERIVNALNKEKDS